MGITRSKTIKYQNADGELQREDGPALAWPDGSEEWWRDNRRVNPPEREHALSR